MEFREQITIGIVFFGFAYIAGLGFWQVLASWQGLRAFSVLPRGVGARWGYLLGSGLLAVAYLWFFGTRTEDIFSPGPASSEFLFFLFVALLCSLATSMVLASLLGRPRPSVGGRKSKPGPRVEPVSIKWWRGALYLPPSGQGPWPAVCAVPEPGKAMECLETLAGGLACEGFVTLVLDLSSPELWRYPDVLAPIPQALDYLERREEVDASRYGLLGLDLGADLAICAAASDKQIAAAVAVAPVLEASGVEPGVDLLREMLYLEAIRWRSQRGDGELVDHLGALRRMPGLQSRPLLVIQGERDRVAPSLVGYAFPHGVKLETIGGSGRAGLNRDARVLASVVNWFKRHL